VCDIEASGEQKENMVSLSDFAKSPRLMKNIDDTVSSNQNGCLIDEDTSEIYFNKETTEVSSTKINSPTDKSLVTDIFLESPSTNVKATNLNNYKNTDDLPRQLFNNCQIFSREEKVCEKQNSANSVSTNILKIMLIQRQRKRTRM